MGLHGTIRIDTSVQKIIYAQAIIESNTGKTSTNVLGICNANGKPRKYDFGGKALMIITNIFIVNGMVMKII